MQSKIHCWLKPKMWVIFCLLALTQFTDSNYYHYNVVVVAVDISSPQVWMSIIWFLFQRKLLAIYLHHDASIQANVFCSQILCTESVVTFLSNNFITWGWDLTSHTNRARYVIVPAFGTFSWIIPHKYGSVRVLQVVDNVHKAFRKYCHKHSPESSPWWASSAAYHFPQQRS